MRKRLVALGAVTLLLVLVMGSLGAGYVLGHAPGGHAPGGASPMWSRMGGHPGVGWSGCDLHEGAEFGRGHWVSGSCERIFPSEGPVASLGEAQEAVVQYVEQLGYEDLHVTEVMEFERNYYAIVAEEETNIGAMELLVDKSSGVVTPEPGPNMMWNVEYGMHRGGMMGAAWDDAEMLISPEQARDITQEWLHANFPSREAGTPDQFYGYYTLHFLKDGQIEGMLSVRGSTGDVWYHSWHGDFVQMTENHGDEDL
ncbi:MAG: hypothetical protein L6435_03625 [Anaerolineae bacterium]|nr:hypothetical protein [Anaerolineae bacterium]